MAFYTYTGDAIRLLRQRISTYDEPEDIDALMKSVTYLRKIKDDFKQLIKLSGSKLLDSVALCDFYKRVTEFYSIDPSSVAEEFARQAGFDKVQFVKTNAIGCKGLDYFKRGFFVCLNDEIFDEYKIYDIKKVKKFSDAGKIIVIDSEFYGNNLTVGEIQAQSKNLEYYGNMTAELINMETPAREFLMRLKNGEMSPDLIDMVEGVDDVALSWIFTGFDFEGAKRDFQEEFLPAYKECLKIALANIEEQKTKVANESENAKQTIKKNEEKAKMYSKLSQDIINIQKGR